MKKSSLFSFVTLAAVVLASCSNPAALTRSGLNPADFESIYDGSQTCLHTLVNSSGMEVCITNFGGRVVSVMVPDRDGAVRDVVLGFDKVSDYFPENNKTDFGASIGRYANRINQGRFTLDGVEYQLPQNNFGHCLHGGPQGWQYKVYDVISHSDTTLVLGLDSPDGDSSFPGAVHAEVTFTLQADNTLDISYKASCDKPTIINMTNHSYFNLSGEPDKHTVCEQILQINSSSFTPVDSTFMTTGEIASLDEWPDFDFRTPKAIGKDIDNRDDIQIVNADGYDHNWVLDTDRSFEAVALSIVCPSTGIRMDVHTDEPGIQIYSGNFLDSSVTGKKGIVYARRTAICFESQKYPDSPNKTQWPSPVLRPGETYTSRCAYSFSVEK